MTITGTVLEPAFSNQMTPSETRSNSRWQRSSDAAGVYCAVVVRPMQRYPSFVALSVALPAILALGCGGSPSSPTSPERYGSPSVTITCEPASSSATACRATVSCALYPCAPGTPADVTTASTWTVDNAHVVRIAGPGQLEAVASGDALVRATWSGAGSAYQTTTVGLRPVSVFPGTAPLPTYEIWGRVYSGIPTARTPIDGATIEVLNGVVSGRTAISGAPPLLLPGFTQLPITPGMYRVLGVPRTETFRLRVIKDRLPSQERDVASTEFDSLDFYLQHP